MWIKVLHIAIFKGFYNMKKLTLLILAVLTALSMIFISGCGIQTDDVSTSSNSETTSSKETSQNGGKSNTQTQVSNEDKENSQTTDKSNVETSVSAEDIISGGDMPAEKVGDIYVSPTGNDSNAGTKGSPLATLTAAVSKAQPGTTIFMMEGSYDISSRINLTSSGTSDKPITIQALDWKKVVLDFTNQPYGNNNSAYVGIYLKGNYWKIQGLEICHAGDNGIKVEGSYNYIGRCVLHHNGDTGIQLGFGHNFSASGYGSSNTGEYCAYNLIENCDSYLNYDFDNHGDADGFACKMHNGKGNVFKGCRAWRNCDDAWDLYETDYGVELIDCWAWESGNKEDFMNDEYFSNASYLSKKGVSRPSSAGNGNGIKLGGNGTGGSSKGIHIARNCVAFGSDITGSVKGFDENSHTDNVILENCVAWDNGYNYMFENGGSQTSFTGCISFYTGEGTQKPNRLAGELGKGTVTNCNFIFDGGDLTMNKAITKDDFVTISEEDAKAPRQADGSLPNNGFAKLKTSSPYYGSGMGLK